MTKVAGPRIVGCFVKPGAKHVELLTAADTANHRAVPFRLTHRTRTFALVSVENVAVVLKSAITAAFILVIPVVTALVIVIVFVTIVIVIVIIRPVTVVVVGKFRQHRIIIDNGLSFRLDFVRRQRWA